MAALTVTNHAAVRMAQRGIKDVELIELVGTEVADGYIVREKDCQTIEQIFKDFLRRVRRLRGKRLVVIDGKIVTAYHADRREERRVFRREP